MREKLRSQAGESIGETLVSVLIVALTFSFLTGAVVSAARVNAKLKSQQTEFHVTDPEELTDYTITVSSGGGELKTITDSDTDPDVTLRRTENGYYYYEVEQAAEP